MSAMKRTLVILCSIVGVVSSADAQEAPRSRLEKAPMVLDLLRGKVLGATLGMDEATVMSALAANRITDIEKIPYPDRFLLQSIKIPGVIFNFRGNKELNDIYIDNPDIVLANGLKLGQPIKDFDAGFGQPVSSKRLPSGIGSELVYAINDFDLAVIVLDRKPDVAKAVTLRKRFLPAPHSPDPAEDWVYLTPQYPKPLFVGTPLIGDIPNLEKPDLEALKSRLTLRVPRGTTNVAMNKKVTSSDPMPIIGILALVTDGDADGSDGCYVELAPGLQWVQIDLGEEYNIWKILLWHFHKQAVVFFSVIVQVSDDPTFKNGVTTLFNNDVQNKSHLGKGTDKNYVETNHGRLIEGKGTKARYVRLWSNGNSLDEMNRYIEVQVFGTKPE
jgi:hypothetical protein